MVMIHFTITLEMGNCYRKSVKLTAKSSYFIACRLRGGKSRDQMCSGDDLLTPLDVKSAARHSVDLA